MRHRFLIVQTYRVDRTIEIAIDVETVESAKDMVDEGRIDVTKLEDPHWVKTRSLEYEEAGPA